MASGMSWLTDFLVHGIHGYFAEFPAHFEQSRPDRRSPGFSALGNLNRLKFSRVLLKFISLRYDILMLVQEIPKASTATAKKPGRGSALYGRAALDSVAQQTRITRHLLELEQDNYHAIQIDIPKPESTSLILLISPLYPPRTCAFENRGNCSPKKTT